MFAFITFGKHLANEDTGAIVRSLVYLRLAVLSAVSLLLALANIYYADLAYGAGLAAVIITVALWSGLLITTTVFSRTNGAAVREIFIDFAWVFCLVLLSGRSANPFIYYYLVLIAICASILSARTAWAFCAGGILVYSSLLILDIGAHFEHMAESYRVHLAGMWLNYVGSSLVTCYFVSRLAKLIRVQQTQLAGAREENLKNEQLIGIGTVAASTVHALATPLSTLTVLAEEMADTESAESDLREDLALMLTQINRCKKTMRNLAALAQGWPNDSVITVAKLQSELEEHYSLNSPGNGPRFVTGNESGKQRVTGNLLLQHALINLINNAVESAGPPAKVAFVHREQQLEIIIENETSLKPDEVFQRWGKPWLSEKRSGLGIGSFLANSTIEKRGGTVRLQAMEGQAIEDKAASGRTRIKVTVSLPLES